jgi:hypothetical protein
MKVKTHPAPDSTLAFFIPHQMSYNMFDIPYHPCYTYRMITKTKKETAIKTLNFTDETVLQRITIREYLRNYKKYNNMVNETKEAIIITNQDTDVVVIGPALNKKRRWTFKEIREKLTFKGGKNLSKNIDKIVYGI